MNVEVINTGNELLLGNTLNTHQQWICRRLTDAGYSVTRQTTAPDTSEGIRAAVGEALLRSPIVITTGGLGPTSDDITREMVAELLSLELEERVDVLEHVKSVFQGMGKVMPDSCAVQAMAPRGATVLMNGFGTAPGLVIPKAEVKAQQSSSSGCLVMLPGPPRELYPMFDRQVVPTLLELAPPETPIIGKTWRTTGVGESRVAEMIEEPLGHLIDSGLDVGYCCRPGEVDVRLSCEDRLVSTVLNPAGKVLERLLEKSIYGVEAELMESIIVKLMKSQRATLACAESCTGGLIAHRITNVPGASEVFRGGQVVYSNEAKEACLGVEHATLEEHGAVSKQVALEMAAGARRVFDSDYALSVTGIAGPSGGSDKKPVGTVWIGLAGPEGVRAVNKLNRFDRESFKAVTSQQALNWLRRVLSA